MAILMFDIDQHEASANAERRRRSLADVPIHVNDDVIAVTLSTGVATFDRATTLFEAMFRESDARLHAAKDAGRNRVQAMSPPCAMRRVGGRRARRDPGQTPERAIDADTP